VIPAGESRPVEAAPAGSDASAAGADEPKADVDASVEDELSGSIPVRGLPAPQRSDEGSPPRTPEVEAKEEVKPAERPKKEEPKQTERPDTGYTWKFEEVSDNLVRETALVEVKFIGAIIGKAGQMIKSIKEQSQAQVDIDQRGEGPRQVIIKGTRAQAQVARELVDDVVWKSIEWERKEQEKKEPWKKMAKETRSRGLATSLLGSGAQGLRPAWVKDKDVSPDDGLMYSRAVMLAARKRLLSGKAYAVPEAVDGISIGDRPRIRMDSNDERENAAPES
jgi:hypothetical protein